MVDIERNETIGLNKIEIPVTNPEILNASSSDFFIAILFGTNSPKTNVKYDKINVIIITAMVSKVERGIFAPIPTTQSTKGSEKLSAAKALPKNPDNVIAT